MQLQLHDECRPDRERIARNLGSLRRLVTAASPVSVLPVEAGWSVVLRVPNTRSEDEWVVALLEEGVLVQPGYFFDLPGDGYLVLSLLTPEEDFTGGVALLLARVDADAGATPAR